MNVISIHIFYHTSHDLLLSECILPLIEKLLDKNLVQQYFYIRYWEQGPHIRLRLFCTDIRFHKLSKRLVERHISNYISKFPAASILNKCELSKLTQHLHALEKPNSNALDLVENNSYKFIPFTPEYDRYGGYEGIQVAVKYFTLSSKASLQVIRNDASRVKRASFAVQMMFLTCDIFLDNPTNISYFMHRYYKYWNKYKTSNTTASSNLISLKRDVKKLIHNALDSPSEFLRTWYIEIKSLHNELLQLSEDNLLTTNLTGILFSYLHMHNNRLGIMPNQEARLAQLIYLVLKDTANKPRKS